MKNIFWHFDTSSLHQFTKFSNLLQVCWFLGKNISNFVPLNLKLHNRYWHKVHYYPGGRVSYNWSTHLLVRFCFLLLCHNWIPTLHTLKESVINLSWNHCCSQLVFLIVFLCKLFCRQQQPFFVEHSKRICDHICADL